MAGRSKRVVTVYQKGQAFENMPHNTEAEEKILSAILRGGARVLGELKSKCGLISGDFFGHEHYMIFVRMEAMVERGIPIDIRTLMQELRRTKEMSEAGGEAFVGELMSLAPVENAAKYVRIVRNKAELRSLFYCGKLLQERAMVGREEPRKIAQEGAEFIAHHLRTEPEEVGFEKRARFQTAEELAQERNAKTEWVCYPWVAAGAITEVSGKVKQAGKTTFVTHMVSAVVRVVPFLNEPVLPTPVVYLTEQSSVTFRVVLERAKLTGRKDVAVLYWNQTIGMRWEEIARMAVAECKARDAQLLVVDTLTQFAGLAGESENSAGDALRALQPLQEAAGHGLGIVIVRHERKRGGPVGDAGRGSSAYGGAVDIAVSIRRPEIRTARTMRLLQSVSRFDETPPELVVELTPEGYEARGTSEDVAVRDAVEVIQEFAPRCEEDAVTFEELLVSTQLKRATAWRSVKKLVAEGVLRRNGAGHRNAPHRYWVGRWAGNTG